MAPSLLTETLASKQLTRSASGDLHAGERPLKAQRTTLADVTSVANLASCVESDLKKKIPSASRTAAKGAVTVAPPSPVDDNALNARPLWKALADLACVPSLESALKLALPDKERFVSEWLKALADPSVCITTIEDVRRLCLDDVQDLPVPPLVKGLFRELIKRNAREMNEQQMVLEATAARACEFLAPLRDRNMQPATSGSKYFQDHKNFRLILTNEEIQAGVHVVSHRIETWCKGDRIVLVGILKGAFMFMSDLCRALTRSYSVQFVEASSYKDGRTQSAGVELSTDIDPSKYIHEGQAPKKIVLIDELLDNGQTMQDMKIRILEKLKGTHTEKDILTVCLFSKDKKRECPVADVTGIPNLPDLWLVGYGLDDRGTKRGWTDLFAAPKVKIVGSIDEDEVKSLMDKLDDNAMLTAPHIFNHFELSCSNSQKYRVSGLDVQGTHHRSNLMMQDEETQVRKKADIQRSLDSMQVFKGKYEHEVLFAFIQSETTLVLEDEIFYGNNQVYAQMRCRLRKSIEASSQRCGLPGLGPLARPSLESSAASSTAGL
jgi:hypoxanthine phosphoribosyltransferase